MVVEQIGILLGCITYMGYHRTRDKLYTYHRERLKINQCCNHRSSPVFYACYRKLSIIIFYIKVKT